MKNRFFFSRLFDISIYIVMIAVGILTLYPFWNILILSFNDATDSIRGGIYLWPRVFTLRNYCEIFVYSSLAVAFRNSVLRTVIGTIFGVISSTMLAYTVSRRDFMARKIISVLFVLTLYFSGGLIPEYMLIRNLGLIGNFWVYILPTMIGAWYVFVLRSYIDGLPVSLQESARIDGANDFTIFYRIVFPLCIPVIATISLFIAVGQWNMWFDTFLFCSNKEELTTLQYELMKILRNTAIGSSINAWRTGNLEQMVQVTPESIRMAITIVSTVPILLVYPFLQKYYVKGLTLGAVKS